MLLERALECEWPAPEDRDDLIAALGCVAQVADKMNREQKNRDQQENLRRIEQMLQDLGALPPGECCRQGVLTLLPAGGGGGDGGGSRFWCYLFDNGFLIGEPAQNSQEQAGFFFAAGGKGDDEGSGNRKLGLLRGIVKRVGFPAGSTSDRRSLKLVLDGVRGESVFEAPSVKEAEDWALDLRLALLRESMLTQERGGSMEQALKTFRRSDDGLFDFDGALRALRNVLNDPNLHESEVRKIFDSVDVNKDDRVSIEELSAALKVRDRRTVPIRRPRPPLIKPPRRRRFWPWTLLTISAALAASAASGTWTKLAPAMAVGASVTGAVACCGEDWMVVAGAAVASLVAMKMDRVFEAHFNNSDLQFPNEGEVGGIGDEAARSREGAGRKANAGPAGGTKAALEFVYQQDWDRRGVLYFLGTKEGNSKSWKNPVKRELVEVTMSSVAHSRSGDKLECAAARGSKGRATCRLRTKTEHGPWVAWNFGAGAGSGRDGGSRKGGWRVGLEEDEKEFKVLKSHTNDDSLQGDYASASWSVDSIGGGNEAKGFKVLRIRDTSTGRSTLHIGGFEVYGMLLRAA